MHAFSSSRHDESFTGGENRSNISIYSNNQAKTSFYSNMQQNAAARNQSQMLSPPQNRASVGSKGSFGITNN